MTLQLLHLTCHTSTQETILLYMMSDNDAIKHEAIVCVSEMLTASI